MALQNSGERTRLACWFRRLAETIFPKDKVRTSEAAGASTRAACAPRKRGAAGRSCLVIALALLLCPTSAFAGARHFTFVYEAPTSPPGSIESENWATTGFNDGFTDAQFRHEIEIGITEHFQASVYLANWDYTRSSDNRGAHYQGSSLELIYNLTNPAADPIGISLYQEISGGKRAFESETKLILQKNFGPLILAYNLVLEAEWEGDRLRERNGEIQHALGASYELSPRVSIGAEMLYEILLPAWKSSEAENNFFLGPNVSYRGNGWFATITALAQTTRTEGEPNCQVRLIFGFSL